MTNSNPLLNDWSEGRTTPPFYQIKVTDYRPVLDQAIAEGYADLERIATCEDTPSFENTIVAIERSQRLLCRVWSVAENLNECDTSDELQAIVIEYSPQVARLSTMWYSDQRLFARVKAVWEHRQEADLDEEQQTLLSETYDAFFDTGAALPEAQRERFAAIEEELAVLEQQFSQNSLADTNDFPVLVSDESRLKGIPQRVVDAAKKAASDAGKEGWLFSLQAPSYVPVMQFAEDRELRKQMWQNYNSRGNHPGSPHDNNPIIRRIAALRAEEAKLLGYDNYAEYRLRHRMVGNLANLEKFYADLFSRVMPAAIRDRRTVNATAKTMGLADGKVCAWDFAYYADQHRKRELHFDAEQVRPYLPLPQVETGVFGLYERLYGLRFVAAPHIEVYHPDVQAFEVFDGDRFMAVLFFDPYARESKRGGAWMTEFRNQCRLANGDDCRPLIQVVCNFAQPTEDAPSLLSFSELTTFLHEMGHAVHGMLSDVRYESLAGTNVWRDFVEMPSQMMENWAFEPEFLHSFARHYQTGELLPDEMLERIIACRSFLEGHYFLRQLKLGAIDLAFNAFFSQTESQGCVGDAFAAERIEALSAQRFLSAELPQDATKQEVEDLFFNNDGYCTATSFGHIFSGGYAAGYYGYKWAEVLDADVYQALSAAPSRIEAYARLRHLVLSKGGTRNPALLFRDFMGRDPNIEPLLRRGGLL